MFNDLANKSFRDAFLEENIRTGIAFQVRSLRERMEWSQAELGRRANKPQNVISRIENPDYGKFTIRTLLDLASAFDVALLISFVPFTKLIAEMKDLSPQALAVESYEEETKVMENAIRTAEASIAQSLSDATEIVKGLALDAARPGEQSRNVPLSLVVAAESSLSRQATEYRQ